MKYLFIVRNNGNNFSSTNHSILGVYTSITKLRKAVKLQRRDWSTAGYATDPANLEVKVVKPNWRNYVGCSGITLDSIMTKPVDQLMKELDSWSTWVVMNRFEV